MDKETQQEIYETYEYEEVRVQESKAVGVATVSKSAFFLEKAVFGILLGTVFLLPVFPLFFDGIAFGFGKNLFLSTAVLSALLLMFFLWLRTGWIAVSKSAIFGAVFLIVFFSLLSSLLSSSFAVSFFGSGAEATTSLQFLLLAASVFLFATFFRSLERIFYALAAFFASAVAVLVFQVLHVLFPYLTAFVNFPLDKTANLIGSWGDFGIFSGLVAILSLVALEMLPHRNGTVRIMLRIFLIVALFFHILAPYAYSWITLAVGALAIVAYVFFHNAGISEENFKTGQTRSLSTSFATVVFSITLVFAAPYINAKLFELFQIPPVQNVRPSWTGTYQTALSSFVPLGKETFLGVGPNKFFISWQQHRPKEVNYTPWWTVDFNEGIGTIPSFLVTSGIFGFLAWIGFLFYFIVGGALALRRSVAKMAPFTEYMAVSFFAAAAYLWIVAFMNTVGIVLFAFAFIFTGLFLGLLSLEGVPIIRDYHYMKNSRKGFAIAVVLLAAVGGSVMLGYEVFERTRSVFAYRNALYSGVSGDAKKADAEFLKAVSLFESDAYYRTFAAFNTYQAHDIFLQSDVSLEVLREQFGMRFRTAVESANKAIAIDDANWLNWAVLGNTYVGLVSLGIEKISDEAYVQAKIAYEQAAQRNPFNPQILYLLTEVALASNHPDDAKNYLRKALELKNDYADALLLFSQIEESQGRASEALAVIEAAPAINFSDPNMLFRLGYLRYKNGKYEEALSVLEKAVRIVPDYSNAKYFLGLSYFETGRTGDALKEFYDIERLNPERADITKIILNLKNGYTPLLSS